MSNISSARIFGFIYAYGTPTSLTFQILDRVYIKFPDNKTVVVPPLQFNHTALYPESLKLAWFRLPQSIYFDAGNPYASVGGEKSRKT